jgi:S1-C subfamily serine protease
LYKHFRTIELRASLGNTKKLTVIFFPLFLIFALIVVSTLLLWVDYVAEARLQSHASADGKENIISPSYYELAIPDLFDKVKLSVVNISPSSMSENISLSGSGFVYDKNGHMITNSHVVATASSVIVTFNDGNQYDAKVIGKDPVNDIAILKISENDIEHLLPVEFGNSSDVRVGERVFAIGNPYGFTNTLTGGFISQVSRLILEAGSGAPYPHPNMIQTDALINPGNSGGPLVNLQGQVIGMNTATINSELGGATGLGFAIPSQTLIREIPTLIENGSYPHPWLGISAVTLTSDLNKEIGLSSNFKGVLVQSLVKNGPAEEAGVQGREESLHGDIITALNGSPISNTEDLLSYIENNKSTGDEITISIYRNNQTQDFIATLGERPISVYTSPYISSQTPLF